MSDVPIYFASDAIRATNIAIDYGREHKATVVARNLTDVPDPLHLDKDTEYFAKNPEKPMLTRASDYYDIWMDLYMLAGAQCVSYGKGGFGKWAALISSGTDCHIRHFDTECQWSRTE